MPSGLTAPRDATHALAMKFSLIRVSSSSHPIVEIGTDPSAARPGRPAQDQKPATAAIVDVRARVIAHRFPTHRGEVVGGEAGREVEACAGGGGVEMERTTGSEGRTGEWCPRRG
jgi:hypothetical protein